MQRKPGFPVTNCNIKIPDSMPMSEGMLEEEEPLQRRQQLINFGHSQWGFNNWSWAVTKQDLDFVELTNGKYTAGVVAFVSVTVKSLDIHRENIGYATSQASYKGAAIHNTRKCAVTNALRETLLSFGGNVTTELLELLDIHRHDIVTQNQNINQNSAQNDAPPEPVHENNQNIANLNKHTEKIVLKAKNDEVPNSVKVTIVPLKNVANPPVAKTRPMPANVTSRPPTANVNAIPPRLPPPAPAPQPILRPNSNDVKLEDMGEEEARAERKRRQKQAQEEFRSKQLMRQKHMDVIRDSTLDTLLMAISSQDIAMEETGNTEVTNPKRKWAAVDDGVAKRKRLISKLDVVDIK